MAIVMQFRRVTNTKTFPPMAGFDERLTTWQSFLNHCRLSAPDGNEF